MVVVGGFLGIAGRKGGLEAGRAKRRRRRKKKKKKIMMENTGEDWSRTWMIGYAVNKFWWKTCCIIALLMI